MQIFHFILDHRIGGPHVYVKTIRDCLSPRLLSTIVTTGVGPLTDMSLTNLRHQHKLLYPFEVICNVFRLCWWFHSRNLRSGAIFDVHGAANVAPLLAARLLGIPVVWHFHETVADFSILVKLGKLALKNTLHRYVVVAEKSAEVFKIESPHFIPGSVDVAFWRRGGNKAESAVRLTSSNLRLIAVGNLNPLKGIDNLLVALGGLDITWELVIVGSELSTFSQYASALRAQANILTQNSCRVDFVGWQAPAAVRDLIAHADVFVLPSRSEACPIALLEAMAMECACVASAVGDVERILGGGMECGITVPAESPEALTNALKHVASLSENGRRELGRRARARIVSSYSNTKLAQRHLDMYLELVQDTGRS